MKPKHAAKSKTILVNTALAAAAILSLTQEHGAALHIPGDWLARISFASAVLTILLRRFARNPPVRFRRKVLRREKAREDGDEEADTHNTLFV
jgi:hypothetical protein